MDISFTTLSMLAEEWLKHGGQPKVELAAMEPTLWKDDKYCFIDVINLFAGMGYKINLTTNGSTIAKYADTISNAPLNKMRISWHTLNSEIYEKMTGGKYDIFLEGIKICNQFNIPICYNRILFKNLTDDIEEHIKIVDEQGNRIKFLELYITHENKNFFENYHMGAAQFLALVDSLPLLKRVETYTPSHASRSRYVWETSNGGRVEFKIAETCIKPPTCFSCSLKEQCVEGFAEYFRVLPNGCASLCYLRNDFDIKIIENDRINMLPVKQTLNKAGICFDEWIQQRSLRLILTSKCNYYCSFPKGEGRFCLGERFKIV